MMMMMMMVIIIIIILMTHIIKNQRAKTNNYKVWSLLARGLVLHQDKGMSH